MAVVVSFLLSLLSCSGSEHTELILVVDTDLVVPDELDRIDAFVEGPDGLERHVERRFDDRGPLPSSLGILHAGGPLGPVQIRVDGSSDDSVVVTRTVSTDFVVGESRLVHVVLSRACRSVDCGTSSTCDAGECVAARIAGDDLPVFGGVPAAVAPTDAAIGDVAVDGGCVDAGAVEACDGVDDDCDGRVDEDAPCPSGSICMDGVCQDEEPCGGCLPTQECVNGECLVSLGERCVTHADCASDVCVAPGVVGLVDRSNLCIETCCADSDCPDDAVCLPFGGFNACLLASVAGRAIGTGLAGADCASAAECRSGVCESDTCAGLCGDDTNCAAPTTCRTGSFPDAAEAHVCRAGGALLGEQGASCATAAQCRSGYCFTNVCQSQCRSSATCPADFGCVSSTRGLVCITTEGTGEHGEACLESADCNDLRCLGDRCHAACCSSRDCASGTGPCRPDLSRGGSGMFCAGLDPA